MPYTCDSLEDLETDLIICVQALVPILDGVIETTDSVNDKTLNTEVRKSTMADAKNIARHQKIRLMAMYEFIEKHNMGGSDRWLRNSASDSKWFLVPGPNLIIFSTRARRRRCAT